MIWSKKTGSTSMQMALFVKKTNLLVTYLPVTAS